LRGRDTGREDQRAECGDEPPRHDFHGSSSATL
jgi:hypothetical protein